MVRAFDRWPTPPAPPRVHGGYQVTRWSTEWSAAAVLSATARGSRFVGIRTSLHGGGTATVKRQTGLVSRDLGGLPRSNIWRLGIKRTIVSMSVLSDLYRCYSPVISLAVTMCVHLPSCPGHSHVRQGWQRRFRVTQASLVLILQFPEILPIRKFFSREREIFWDPGKSSPVNIPNFAIGSAFCILYALNLFSVKFTYTRSLVPLFFVKGYRSLYRVRVSFR